MHYRTKNALTEGGICESLTPLLNMAIRRSVRERPVTLSLNYHPFRFRRRQLISRKSYSHKHQLAQPVRQLLYFRPFPPDKLSKFISSLKVGTTDMVDRYCRDHYRLKHLIVTSTSSLFICSFCRRIPAKKNRQAHSSSNIYIVFLSVNVIQLCTWWCNYFSRYKEKEIKKAKCR